MNDYKKWLKNYTISVQFPNVSGFEILEMLQARSHLAEIENNLPAAERAKIESADAIFLTHVDEFFKSLVEISDLGKLRKELNILPSHWWWYLDKLLEQKQTAMTA